MVSRVLGALRLHLGRELGLIDETPGGSCGSPTSRCSNGTPTSSAGTPSTIRSRARTPKARPLLDADPGAARAIAYDLVGNGIELAGGSFRIHEPELQAKVFGLLAISPEEQRAKFGFLLDALAMGAPPHGGIASGIDRLAMALLDEAFIRDTLAFPKNQAGVDPMSGAPTPVEQAQLDELGIAVTVEEP